MMSFRSFVAGGIAAVLCLAGESQAPLHFPINGFSIAPLEGVSDAAAYQFLAMFLPATEGFAPNINVQIQPYKGSLKDYAALSQRQFKAMGFTVLREEIALGGITWEYQGKFQGGNLHWYARAIPSKGKIYLVTATASETQWKTVSGQLTACVDSFKTDGAEGADGVAKDGAS